VKHCGGAVSHADTYLFFSADVASESSLHERLAACQFYQYNQMQPEDSRVFPKATAANHMYKAIQAGKAKVSGGSRCLGACQPELAGT
jgi:hypothetical protein